MQKGIHRCYKTKVIVYMYQGVTQKKKNPQKKGACDTKCLKNVDVEIKSNHRKFWYFLYVSNKF